MIINKIFLENVINPMNGKIVKSIYFYKLYKTNKYNEEFKTMKYMKWQYYKNRANKSIKDVLNEFIDSSDDIYQMRIIYLNDPKEYIHDKKTYYLTHVDNLDI